VVQQGHADGVGQRSRARNQQLEPSNDTIVVADGIRMSSTTGSTSWARRPMTQPPRRHQPRRHRQHRDREKKGPSAATPTEPTRRTASSSSRPERSRGQCRIGHDVSRGRLLDDRKWLRVTTYLAGMNPHPTPAHTNRRSWCSPASARLKRGLVGTCVKRDGNEGLRQLRVLSPDQERATHPTGHRQSPPPMTPGLPGSQEARTRSGIHVGWPRQRVSACFRLDDYEKHRDSTRGLCEHSDWQMASELASAELVPGKVSAQVNRSRASASTLATTR